MGIFSNISNFITKKREEHKTRSQENESYEKERRRLTRQAELEELPTIVKARVRAKNELEIKNIKSGKLTGGFWSGQNLQGLAHGIGQSTRSGGGRSRGSSRAAPVNTFDKEFNDMFRQSPSPRPAKRKITPRASHKKTSHRKGKSNTINL